MSEPMYILPGRNTYTVELNQPPLSYANIRIAHENIMRDEVKLSLSQFLSLMDWGMQHYDEFQNMAKEQ